MTARHREPTPAVHARYRLLLIVLVALFVLAFFFLRVLGSDDDGGEPGAVASTTTTMLGGTTTPGETGSSTTTPGDSGSSTTPGSTAPALAPLQSISLDLVFDGFRQPSALAAPTGDDRLFVAQRVGVIRILDVERTMLEPAFLDIQDLVLAGGIEQGLLGLAFHPDYANNGRFYVYFTDKSGNRQLSEFTVSPTDPNVASVESERVIFEFPQPANAVEPRHYGGGVQFGPDGYLWVSMGDGADSRAQGQDPNTPYGTIFRIDVDNGDPYAVPADNPFVDGGGMPEVWAYGLRNPWRFSIDPLDGLVYVADVGHDQYEEVNVVTMTEGGYNFGWSDMEGPRCFHKEDCNAEDYTSPVLTYFHVAPEDQPDAVTGLSITGGFVYRGEEIPEIAGTYFYADWVSQWVRGFEFVDGQVTDDRDWTEDLGGPVGSITSFGVDGHGELFVTTYEGAVYKFTAVR